MQVALTKGNLAWTSNIAPLAQLHAWGKALSQKLYGQNQNFKRWLAVYHKPDILPPSIKGLSEISLNSDVSIH
jgi:hypothetical protein